jgi:hypothetical protein
MIPRQKPPAELRKDRGNSPLRKDRGNSPLRKDRGNSALRTREAIGKERVTAHGASRDMVSHGASRCHPRDMVSHGASRVCVYEPRDWSLREWSQRDPSGFLLGGLFPLSRLTGCSPSDTADDHEESDDLHHDENWNVTLRAAIIRPDSELGDLNLETVRPEERKRERERERERDGLFCRTYRITSSHHPIGIARHITPPPCSFKVCWITCAISF